MAEPTWSTLSDCGSSAWWRGVYPDVPPEHVNDEMRRPLVAELRRQGLAPKSASDYASTIIRAERYCRERGTTVQLAPVEMLLRFSSGLALPKRAMLGSALRRLFPVLGRPAAELAPLRVGGRQPGRSLRRSTGKRAGTPHRGHEWEQETGPAGERHGAFRRAMRNEGLSERTIRSYADAAWRLEQWCEATRRVMLELDGEELAEYCESLAGPSRRLLRSALKRYYVTAGRPDAPVDAIRVPRKRRMTARPLELDEAKRLLAAALEDHHEAGAAVLLGLLLGLRRAEIAELRWGALADGWLTFVGKGNLEASLPVPALLSEYLAHLPRRGPYVFAGQGGSGHVNACTVYNRVRGLASSAGLGKVSTHRLRHTCITYANDATGDLRSVQEFARHADPDTTAGYTRVTRDRLRTIGNAVLEVLGAPPDGSPVDPAVPFSLMVRACEGQHAVGPWLELARLLMDRPGWCLETSDDGAGRVSFVYGRDLTASVLAWASDRPPTFVLTRELHPDESEHIAWWNFPDTGSLCAVLAEFETGQAVPFPPSATTFGAGPSEALRAAL